MSSFFLASTKESTLRQWEIKKKTSNSRNRNVRTERKKVSKWQLWSGFRNQTRLDEAVVEKLGGKNIIDKLANMLELSKISACHLKYVVEHFLNT